MNETKVSLNEWFERVQKATTAKQVLQAMDEFRKQEWSDEDCSKMAKVYMRVLDRVGGSTATSDEAATEDGANDGPVWYEKM